MSSESVVVVVEDDAAIADLLDLYLRRAGFRPLLAATGERGLELIDQQHGQQRPVLAIVDIGLPGIDGFEVCRRLHERADIPVLFLTARDGEDDRVAGLELGADDYVAKPFSPRELVARVQAIHRRQRRAESGGDWLDVGGRVELDTDGRRVQRDGVPVALATREYELLEFLARHQGMALSRQQLLDGVWGAGWDGDQRTVDVHVRQLRRKLGADLPLSTVWGFGYRLG